MWYVYEDTFTATSIILLAELSPSIVEVVTKESLEESWAKCYSCFDHLRLYNVAAERCARSLLIIRSKCLAAASGKLLVLGSTRNSLMFDY